MELRLYQPEYNELFFRQSLLSDPETMAFNRFKDPGPDYDPKTGCIEFPRGTWALWYDFWLEHEPDNFYAVIADGRTPLGEISWHFDGEEYRVGIILLAKHRRKGYCAPTLELLCRKAFETFDLPALSATVSTANPAAGKGLAKAGFVRIRKGGGSADYRITKEQWQQNNKEETT